MLFYGCLLLGPTVLLAAVLPAEWTELELEVYNKLHQGCFQDASKSRDLPYLVATNPDANSVVSCVRQCREQGFRFAGLQDGSKCYCGNNAVRQYEEALDCNHRCPGNSAFTCGGATSNDVYYVSTDDKYLGCYTESPFQRDLPFFQWDKSAGKSAADCIYTCGVQDFRYAGVQDGGSCYCGDDYGRHGPADEAECGMQCFAWANQNCGGNEANAIYRTEIVGELSDLDADKFSTRLPVSSTTQGSPGQYPAPHRGHQASIQHHTGEADQYPLSELYRPIARETRGSEDPQGQYPVPHDTFSEDTEGWDQSGQVAGIPTTLFTLYPALRTVLTNRLIIHTSTPVQTPFEDSECANNCYETCGEIFQEDDLTATGSDVILRFFFLKLSDLSSYVGSNAKRVFVYAQTIVIDQSVDLPFSLLIRTKQMFIDRSTAITIDAPIDGQPFDLDLEASRFDDIEPNLLQQKMALTCARILHDTHNQDEVNLAYTMLRDIANTRSHLKEAQAYAGTVRGYMGKLTGVMRADVHFVPFLTKDRLADVLKTYFTEIDIYRKNYDAIRRVIDDTEAFLDYAEAMSKTYTNTDVLEARLAYDSALTAIVRSNETYNRFRFYYEASRDKLDELKVVFEKGLKEKEGWDIARAVIKFITGIGSIVTGSITFDQDDVADSASGIIDDVVGLFDTAYNLANTIRQIDELSLIADRIIVDLEEVDNTDYLRNLDDVEQTVMLNVNIIKWRNLKNYATSVLSNPEILRVNGAANYHRQLMDVCNWGESLTKSMVERAELLRGAIDSRTILDAKEEQERRLLAHIDDTRNGIIPSNERVLADITEQSYDVRMDLNKALIVFCQAYFYENMFECSESYKPSFGGSLTELLIKINAASLDNLLTGSAPSTVEREVVLKDEDLNPTCIDNLRCPINYLKRNRMLYFELPTSLPALVDLDAYKVAEIRLNVTGVKTANADNPWLKIKIESSGKFKGHADGTTYNFITKAMSATFEYNIITNYISVYADIAAPFRDTVQHITPFTTWVMRISPDRSEDIDFTDVTSIAIRFRGSAVDNETWKKNFAEAHPELVERKLSMKYL